MELTSASRFFLGANSKAGFFSLYDSFTDPAAGDFIWVIKGSPGCGKSSFMKRIGTAAENAGLCVEYILCSGDPDSLDAVRFPERHIAYVDGTAPHVIEPHSPGAAGLYLDLGAFLDAGALRRHLTEITELERRYRAEYANAYALLSAAAALSPKNRIGSISGGALRSLERRIDGIAARELPAQKRSAAVQHRFLSAWSCQGHVILTDTLNAMCGRVCLLDNTLGLGHAALERLAAQAQARGYDAICCHDPLEPDKLEALILPVRSLAFLAAEETPSGLRQSVRRMRLDAPAKRELSPEERALLRRARGESGALLRSAEAALARAKALHDALEAVYHPHVDFDGVGALAGSHIRAVLDAPEKR